MLNANGIPVAGARALPDGEITRRYTDTRTRTVADSGDGADADRNCAGLSVLQFGSRWSPSAASAARHDR